MVDDHREKWGQVSPVGVSLSFAEVRTSAVWVQVLCLVTCGASHTFFPISNIKTWKDNGECYTKKWLHVEVGENRLFIYLFIYFKSKGVVGAIKGGDWVSGSPPIRRQAAGLEKQGPSLNNPLQMCVCSTCLFMFKKPFTSFSLCDGLLRKYTASLFPLFKILFFFFCWVNQRMLWTLELPLLLPPNLWGEKKKQLWNRTELKKCLFCQVETRREALHHGSLIRPCGD